MTDVLSKAGYMQAVEKVASACFGYSIARLEELEAQQDDCTLHDRGDRAPYNSDQVVEKHHAGLVEELLSTWNDKKVSTKRLTYIASFAEIDRADTLGRLSMWRAYGGRAGVALCLNPKLLEEETDDLSVFHSPVLYGPPETLRDELLNILNRLESIEHELSQVERDIVTLPK